ncbi:MAG: DUF5711 family protein [Ruminococcus sp.]|nr:DUF5711 family protein [Ruminococcus sp.]
MAVTDISELRKKRRAKQTKNMIMRVFIVILICGAVVVAVFTKDMWYPYLNGILSVTDNVQTDSIAAELAEGRFPLKVEGGVGYQLMSMDGTLALLDDSQFHVYSNDGKIMNERHHTFANPILCVSGGKALIYDEGGKDFSLESKYKTIYEKTADDVIYLAKLSRSDYAAVVTKSDKFLAMLKVYDPNGDPVFTYYSYDSRIINVTFNNNSTGCVVTVLTAEGGQLWSKMIRFDFTDTEPKWIGGSIPALALNVEFTSDDGIIMIGDTMAAGFDKDGTEVSRYVYDNKIYDYDSNGDITAIITTNSDIRRTDMIIISGSDCAAPVLIELEDAKKVFTESDQAYILYSGGIDVYSSLGRKNGEITLEDDYDDLCRSGKYIYLLGYDSINRIDY